MDAVSPWSFCTAFVATAETINNVAIIALVVSLLLIFLLRGGGFEAL